MTWDDDRLSFFSAFLPRYLDTLYFGSGTIIVCWLLLLHFHKIEDDLLLAHYIDCKEGKTCNEIGVTAGFKANVITVTPFYQKYYYHVT